MMRLFELFRALKRGSTFAGRFRRDLRGATAVEFAMVSGPFIGLLFAIFESAFVYLATEGLDAAVADAGRYVMTGQALTGNYQSSSAFRDAVICNPSSPRKRILPSFIDCSQLIVDVRTAGSTGSTTFSGIDTTTDFYTQTPLFCVGAPSDIVIVRVVYPMPVYLSILSATSLSQFSVSTAGQTNYNGTMTHLLLSTTVFRNEPFSGSYTPPAGC